MQSFGQYVQSLQEKLIVLNGGAKYNQVVFLAGGGGSGKGFAAQNFMQSDLFKIRDVDAMKSSFIELNRLFQEISKLKPCNGRTYNDPHPHKFGGLDCNPYSELQGIDLRQPGDVFALHAFVDKLGVKDKSLKAMMQAVNQANGNRPNIMFDITAKDVKSISNAINGDGKLPGLLDIGYQPENIHLVWILANYSVAVERNAKRSRVVPDDVLLQTHEGAANTMFRVLQGHLPSGLNGGVYVVLNRDLNPEDFYPDSQNKSKQSSVSVIRPASVVKDFTYIKYKDAGHPMMPHEAVQQQIYDWITSNIPKTHGTEHIFTAGGIKS